MSLKIEAVVLEGIQMQHVRLLAATDECCHERNDGHKAQTSQVMCPSLNCRHWVPLDFLDFRPQDFP